MPAARGTRVGERGAGGRGEYPAPGHDPDDHAEPAEEPEAPAELSAPPPPPLPPLLALSRCSVGAAVGSAARPVNAAVSPLPAFTEPESIWKERVQWSGECST